MRKLTIMTLNIGEGGSKRSTGVPLSEGLSAKKKDIESAFKTIAHLARHNEVDIVALQEVDDRTSRVYGMGIIDIANELKEATDVEWKGYYSCSIKLRGGEYGNLLLTKCEILRQRRSDLGGAGLTYSTKRGAERREENRSVARIEITMAGIRVWVLNLHLGLGVEAQKLQISKLIEIINGTSERKVIVLCGDFNVVDDPESDTNALLKAINELITRKDKFVDLGPKGGVTFPKMSTKVDYCFLSSTSEFRDKCDVSSAEVVSCPTSDHNALKFSIFAKPRAIAADVSSASAIAARAGAGGPGGMAGT